MTGRPQHHGSTSSIEGDGSRAVSITLNYVLALGISTILVSGLLIAGGGFVMDQRERVIEGELNVVGQHVASNIEQVDRYVKASDGDPDTAYVNQTFQHSVTGATYYMELEEDPDRVVLTSNRPQLSVEVNTTVDTALDVDDGFAAGGTVSVYYDADAGPEGKLVITNA